MSRLLATLALCAAAGCHTSILIRPGDDAFAHAQGRLQRVAEQLDADEAPAAEKLIFLEAEAFYRYRFAPPPRGAATYLAQTAAAVTDFPAFQSLAGAMDLADLRMRSADGAVHLWESLLTLYPKTSLRPFALYRLGWAYRNTSISGLPRKSGSEAFDLLIKEQPGAPLAGFAAQAKAVPWKSKGKATAFSIIPGLGQMYVGNYGSGVARLLIALASAAAVVTPAIWAIDKRRELTWEKDWPLLATSLVGLVVLSIDYTTAYQDATRGAQEFNERKEREFELGHADAP